MPRHKSSTKHNARKTKRLGKRAPIHKALPKGIILKKSDDVIAKLRVLEKYGLYKPNNKITRQNITKSQKQRTLKHFNDVMQNGIIKNSRVIRPFKRAMNGYTLNKPFNFAEGKIKRGSPGIIKTRTGAIVQSDNHKAIIRPDGTIIRHEKIDGKNKTIYSGSLNDNQIMAFIKQVDAGTFKFPRNMKMRLSLFDNVQSSELYSNVSQLQSHFAKYFDKIQTYINGHPSSALRPITMEFYT